MTAFRVGTSGFSYKEWRGIFYPEALPERLFLGFYGERFATVEINNTFYRMPAPALLAKWKAEVPPAFIFALKAPQRITHYKQLADVAGDVQQFLEVSAGLGLQLGPLLFQLPPYLRRDLGKLRALLALVPPARRVALEFRHPSWHDAETYAVLRDHGAALCLADTDAMPEAAPVVSTAPWTYVRLRREHYNKAALASWAHDLETFTEAFVFFKHEERGAGPAVAAAFAALVGEERLPAPVAAAVRPAALSPAGAPPAVRGPRRGRAPRSTPAAVDRPAYRAAAATCGW